jgi:hypothetical protein
MFLLILTIALASVSCDQSSRTGLESSNTSSTAPVEQPRVTVSIRDFSEPPLSSLDPGVVAAWKQFTLDGQYRLARAADMLFTEDAKRRINASFSMWQGDTTFGGEFVALVVDTTLTAKNRFGIVLFRPDKTWARSATYSPRWLMRNRDLSTTAIDRVSGYLFIHSFTTGDTYESCRVQWNSSKRRYICR